jgi:hypothetical protein
MSAVLQGRVFKCCSRLIVVVHSITCTTASTGISLVELAIQAQGRQFEYNYIRNTDLALSSCCVHWMLQQIPIQYAKNIIRARRILHKLMGFRRQGLVQITRPGRLFRMVWKTRVKLCAVFLCSLPDFAKRGVLCLLHRAFT